MNYDYATIEARMKSLPDDLQQAMVSADVENAVYDIAENRGLDIEQAGMLANITSYVMLGLLPSKNFISELSKQTGISNEEADQIGIDINKGIFDKIRESLRKVEEDREKNGGVVVEKTPSSVGTFANNPNNTQKSSIKVALPIASPDIAVPPKPLTTPTTVAEPVPFIDHLLSGPTSTGPENMPAMPPVASIPQNPPSNTAPVVSKPATPTPAEPTRPPYSVDPYREPIE